MFNNGLLICWYMPRINGDSIIDITYPITFSSVFCFVITLQCSVNYINNSGASQVWIYEYNNSTARIGNDWSTGNVFCLLIGS